MAALAIQKARATGKTVTMAAASSGGDTVPIGGTLLVRNGDSSSHTVTVAVPGDEYGQARPDIPVVVAAGAIALIGPLSADLADPTDNLVHVSYSAVTSVTVAAIDV